MDDRTWTIVQFSEDLTVEAIPTSWIQGEWCHWPPFKQEKLTTSIKKCEALNTNWPRHTIKIFRNATFDDYAKARLKAKVAEDFSDLNSESECKGKRKRIQKMLSSSSDESLENIENTKLPPPPKMCKLSIKPNANDTVSSANLGQSKFEETFLKNTPSSSAETMVHQTVSNTAVKSYGNANSIKEWPDALMSFLFIIKFWWRLKNQNHLIRGILVNVLNEIRELNNNKVETTSTSIFVKFPDIQFPIENDEDFHKFEEELGNEGNFNEVVNELAKFGGSNPYNFIKRSMSSILNDSVLKNYSWLGRKGKKSLENSLTAKALLQAAEKCLRCNRKDVELAIQSFVKRSSERMKNKVNKNNGL
ncbi:hypothetical protein NQ314_019801 [Rhamnusium bicolor]|uniref:DUF4806 domain-containing protein n=1 Tax=Rhamnusium bicolor TaxID=1586634 RepID=A0AAV8WMK9_9CUCU|nr:hypothetical protein NQ314_019801 [Rhamnusium bicolor]